KDERGLLKRDVFTKHFQRRGRLTEFTLKDFLLNQDLMWTGALTIKKGILLDAGLFPTCEKCRKGGDLDTWIRCLIISKQNIYLDEHLAIYYRDTVNRVTDEKRNQTYYLCSYETLNNLNKKTKEYNKEITHFLNKKLYNLAITKVRIDNTIDFDLIKKMKLNGVSFLYLLKLILVRFKIVK